MADRSVVVRLVANVAGYVSGIGTAAKATKDFGASTIDAAAKHKQSMETISRGVGIAGVALVGLAAASVLAASAFDKQMSVVKANVDDKSVPAMKRLADAALQAGRTTAYSATEAAKGEEELAKAGLSASQITGGALSAALSLASAGQMDLGSAAEITASTMTQFGLKASSAAHIADLLAAGADKSLGGVTDLAEGLKYAGVPAAQFGVSLDETVGVLAEFASNGILGSMAGTSFREMMVRLASPTAAASDAMKTLGLNFFDANGKFIGMAATAQQLHDKLGGLTDQQRQATLSTLFGARAMATSNILYRDGAKGVQEWTNKVNDAGFAQEQAATKLDNLSGDFTKLKNSVNVAFIEMGQSATGPLRGVVQHVTDLVNAFSDLPGPVKGGITVLSGVAGASLLAVAGLMKLVTFAGEAKKAFNDLALASKLSSVASFLTGPLGLALAAGAVAVGIFAKAKIDAAHAVSTFEDALKSDSGALGENTRQAAANALEQAGLLKLAPQYHLSYAQMTDAVLHGGDAMQHLQENVHKYGTELNPMNRAQLEAGTGQRMLTSDAKKLLGVVGDQNSALNKAVDSNKRVADATKKTGDAASKATDGTKGLTSAELAAQQAADADKKAHDALVQSIKDYGSATLSARGSSRAYQQALDDATKALKTNGATLNINTQAGRDNQAVLDNIASSALAMAVDNYKNNESVKAVTKGVMSARTEFIDMATKMGMSRSSARALADQLGLTRANVGRLSDEIKRVPTSHKTTITVNAGGALSQVIAVRNAINALHDRHVTITTTQQNAFNKMSAMPARASGGPVSAGTTYLVGEQGPELWTAKRSGYIIPAAQTDRIMSSRSAPVAAAGGGVSVYVENPWTGEQVQARVVKVAAAVADARIERQGRRAVGGRNF